MDLVTQGLAGAALAAAAARPAHARLAAAVGAVAGLLPDADVLLGSAEDPLAALEVHRHFTHALVLAPAGALLVALLAWPLARRRLGFPELLAYALLGIAPAGLLDALTSFGTHLLWPFDDARVAWNLLAVVDPLFSLPLLAGVLLALRRRSPVPARAGIALALAYLALAGVQRQRAEDAASALARSRGHEPARLEVKPTMGNVLLWRAVYLEGGAFHVDALRAGLGAVRVYPGGSIARLEPRDVREVPEGSVAARDVARFERIAAGHLVRHPERPEVIGDVRYSMRPDGTAPLWGIVVDPARPDRHVEFVTLRPVNAALGRDLLAMLRGRDLAPGGR
jgi:inner membrane protein